MTILTKYDFDEHWRTYHKIVDTFLITRTINSNFTNQISINIEDNTYFFLENVIFDIINHIE